MEGKVPEFDPCCFEFNLELLSPWIFSYMGRIINSFGVDPSPFRISGFIYIQFMPSRALIEFAAQSAFAGSQVFWSNYEESQIFQLVSADGL